MDPECARPVSPAMTLHVRSSLPSLADPDTSVSWSVWVKKMLTSVKESLVFFSEKQRLELAKCKLAQYYRTRIKDTKGAESDDDDDSDRERSRRGDDRKKESKKKDDDGNSRRKSNAAVKEDAIEDSAGQSWIEHEYTERQRLREQQREEELVRLESQRKEQEEREARRKSRLGNAFLMADEEEEEPELPTMPIQKKE